MPVGKNPAIRQAAAQIFDRDAIAKNAYDGIVAPLYSIVPPGYAGQTDSFKAAYGSPNVAAAKKILADAGVKTPVNLTIGYSPTHYGPNAVDEATEVQRQLEESGLFKVTLKSAEWEQYQTINKQGAYDLFQIGWFPDYPDTDDYSVALHGGRRVLPERLLQRGGQQAGRGRAGYVRPGPA